MDFDIAVNKLARNHSKQLRRGRASALTSNQRYSSSNRASTTHLSLRAKKEAEERKRKSEAQKRAAQIQKNKLRKTYAYFSGCERALGTVKGIMNANSDNSMVEETNGLLMLKPTSIYGDGDKITLPVSVLSALMELKDSNSHGMTNVGNSGSPFEFRIGILNPEYKFPMSPSLKKMMEDMKDVEDDADLDFDMDESDDEGDQDDPMNENKSQSINKVSPFLDELSYKYLSYTHCTVVEFTQEEGYVGLPQSVARALLNNDKKIPTIKTVDPASSSLNAINSNKDSDAGMVNVEDDQSTIDTNAYEDKTPGHLAWGEFDVPDLKVEIVLVNLPKGKGCTLVPTKEAVQNGFHNLRDIKAALEQSLIRTKATLSLNDNVQCWYRGKKFDLMVSSLTPNTYNAVSCINTDIEVDIGESSNDEKEFGEEHSKTKSISNEGVNEKGRVLGSTLGSSTPTRSGNRKPLTFQETYTQTDTKISSSSSAKETAPILPPEPPSHEKNNVCNIQIRGDGKVGRRRFDIQSCTLNDLFTYAAFVGGILNQKQSFRLVTRFPRRIFEGGEASLKDAGISEGQEMFMIELC